MSNLEYEGLFNATVRGYSSPGVGYKEQEIIPSRLGVDPSIVGIIGTASKGPLGLTHVYSEAQLRGLFGEDIQGEFGLIAASNVLKYSQHIIYCRVVNKETAQFAKAGPKETSKFSFASATYDDTLNGASIDIKILDNTLKGSLTVHKDDVVYEKITGFHVNEAKQDEFFLPNLLASKSNIITAVYNEEATDESYDVQVGTEYPVLISLSLAGGDAGKEISDLDIIGEGNQGIAGFKAPDTVDISTLITPGYYSQDVFDAVQDVIEYRGDFMYIADYPRGLSPTQVTDFFEGMGEFSDRKLVDNQWFCTYYDGWLNMYYNKNVITVPPSVYASAQWAHSDSTSQTWFAPAGFDNNNSYGRGVMESAVSTEYGASKEERDHIYVHSINPVTKFVGKGITLFGNKTMLRTGFYEEESLMTSLNVRRLCNYIRKVVINVSYTELFNPNDEFTWNSWRLKIIRYMEHLKSARGISNYRVVMDKSTVTHEDIRNRRMPGTIFAQPVVAAEWIPVTFIVTDNEIFFNEGTPIEFLDVGDSLVGHSNSK